MRVRKTCVRKTKRNRRSTKNRKSRHQRGGNSSSNILFGNSTFFTNPSASASLLTGSSQNQPTNQSIGKSYSHIV